MQKAGDLLNKDPQVDPAADDLATLGLDLLMGENKFVSNGLNFFMIHSSNELLKPKPKRSR